MKNYDKIKSRAELNNLKMSELDALLKRYGLKKGIFAHNGSHQQKVDTILSHYKHMFNTNCVYLSWDDQDVIQEEIENHEIVPEHENNILPEIIDESSKKKPGRPKKEKS